LKAAASENIPLMFVTLLVSQLPMSWLKTPAPWNIPFMSVTLLVSAEDSAGPRVNRVG
jgi:hypothetical protein